MLDFLLFMCFLSAVSEIVWSICNKYHGKYKGESNIDELGPLQVAQKNLC